MRRPYSKRAFASLGTTKILSLARLYADAKDLTIEVTAEGIQIGNTRISRDFWEISLFDNPDTAPETLPKPQTIAPEPPHREDELPFAAK